MTPETRLLLAELRVARPAAIRRLRTELRRHEGNVRATASALGVAVRTMYRLRDDVPEVAAALADEAMGRRGAASRAREALAEKIDGA